MKVAAPADSPKNTAATPIAKPLIAIALVMLLIFEKPLKLGKFVNRSVFMVNFLFLSTICLYKLMFLRLLQIST
ncbi:hypothetical protein [Chamaesiphon sp. OTE_20_metabat_361]|uniref:hypothetical protein n=1 Tax=Chamaesiphon sp. OTE_20_metabat_361 TaxID=2964689 RepID=UPI00286BCF09|nr:hypothetical protein [Chamaesiphon sp. OTE_20_metabat_361]